MAQLTLRTLLAYIDDTLKPRLARELGAKVAESDVAQQLIDRIKKVTRRRGLHAPAPTADDDGVSDPNTVAEYLSNTLDSEQVTRLEEICLASDVHLAEVAACHQILTLVLTEPVRVPPRSRQRMYSLVPPPASLRNRRPGKTVPVGGAVPDAQERLELEDTDAPLLLGLGRYGAGSVLSRLALVGAAVVLAVFLGVAVLMALPGTPPEPPETSPGVLYAAAPKPPAPAPKPAEGEAVVVPKPAEPELPVAPPPVLKEETPVEAKRVAPPRRERVAVGKVQGVNELVVTHAPGPGEWLRLDPGGEAGVASGSQVLCLPGYKSDVLLDTGVKVHLWGNVPELLPARLLEARVVFHLPERNEAKDKDFDADLTVLAGRVYLTATRPAGARVRVRFADQAWDVTLPDEKTEVMVEVATSFEPGTPYVRGGQVDPRVEAQAAVVRGAARLAVPDQSKTFDKVAAPSVARWDSTGGPLADPKPIEPGNGYYDKFLTGVVASEQGKLVQKALTQMAQRVTERNGVKLMLAEYLTEPVTDPVRMTGLQLAVYGQAAIVYGDTAGDELKPLIDLLTDEGRAFARLAAVNALAPWIAQAPGNTALLDQQLSAKIRRDGEPETIIRLLRGYVNPAKPDPDAVDRLVTLLTDPSVAVRELAQWNLLSFVDPSAAKPDPAMPKAPVLVADVSAASGPGYERYVKAWKARVEEIKARPPAKKP